MILMVLALLYAILYKKGDNFSFVKLISCVAGSDVFVALPFLEVPCSLHIKGGVHIVNILLIQLFPQKLNGFTNTGNMKYRKRAANTYYRVTVSYRQSPSIVVKL